MRPESLHFFVTDPWGVQHHAYTAYAFAAAAKQFWTVVGSRPFECRVTSKQSGEVIGARDDAWRAIEQALVERHPEMLVFRGAPELV